MAGPMQGWSALGEMLGGGVGEPGAYEDGLKAGYSVEKALQDARRARSQALIDSARYEARSAFTPEVMAQYALGDPAAQAQVLAGTMGAATTPDLRRLGDHGRPHYLTNVNAAQEAIEAGDAATYNRLNAAALGEEYQPVQVLGGAYVPDGMTMDAIHAVPTPESLSRIEQNEAQAEASLVRANRAPAAKAPRAPSAAASEAAVLAQAREKVAGGADPAAVAQYLIRKGYPGVAKRIHAPVR